MAMPDEKVDDVQRAEEYQLTGLKNVNLNNDVQSLKSTHVDIGQTDSQNEPNDEYSGEVIEEETSEEENDMFLLRLIAAVKLYPAIYDPNFEPQLPRQVIKKQKADAWMRISMDMAWSGDTPLESVWNDLLDQYARRINTKLDDEDPVISQRVAFSLQWIDQFIPDRIKSVSLPIVRSNTAPNNLVQQSGIEKDTFYTEMPQNITEDVMISGCRPVVSHSAQDYVVVQQQRVRHSSHQPQSSTISQNSTARSQTTQQPIPRNYSMPQHPTSQMRPAQSLDASQSNRRNMAQTPSAQSYSPKRVIPDGQILQVIKKDDNNTGAMTMMVDMTTFYQNGSGQKMYRLLSVPAGSQQPPIQIAQLNLSQQNQQNERKFDIQRNSHSNIVYDLPPEPIIEGSPNTSNEQPPRKKIAYIPPRSSMNSTASTNNTTMMQNNRVEDNTIMAGGVQISGDEIIDDGIQESTIVIDPDGHLHEESPLLRASPDVMISGQSARGHQPQMPIPTGMDQRMAPTNSQMAAASTSVMHQHHHHSHPHQQHHQSIVRRGRTPVDEVDHGEVENSQEDMMNPQTQYDADLQFQQLISSHLSRLNDDDKAIMKYNMQRILLDARFGEGTAKQLLAEEDILDNEPVHGDLEPAPIAADDAHIQ